MSDDKARVISVVISYNDCQNTLMTVASLLNQTIKTKIVVWDNNSHDGTCDLLEKQFGDKIIVHRSDENMYWTPAINKAFGLYYDGEDIIHYSNNDIEYPSESLERMIGDLLETGAGAVGPTGSALGGMQDYVSHHNDNRVFYDFSEFYEHIKDRKPVKTSSIQGACMIMRADVWKLVGPLDNNMPLGADDFDYSIRIKAIGLPLYISERSYIGHKGHASGPGNESTWNNMGSISWDWFNKKWHGYYFNELEALRCMWAHEFHEGWTYGTGWMDENSRLEVWKQRGFNYDGSPIHNSLS